MECIRRPKVCFRRKVWLFVVLNILLVLACNFRFLTTDVTSMPEVYRTGFSSFVSIAFLINFMAIGIALSIRYLSKLCLSLQRNNKLSTPCYSGSPASGASTAGLSIAGAVASPLFKMMFNTHNVPITLRS